MAGLVDKTEMAAINGVPLLSLIPVLGKAFSYETKQHSADELLVVLTPYITVGRGQHGSGSYVILPTNVPK
jgi:type II secretory pathway component GspD/PulD (secretin)